MRINLAILSVIFGLCLFTGFEFRTTNEISLMDDPQCYTVAAKSEPVVPSSSETDISSLTQEELELIALVTMGEAEGETELGKRLVIDSILNRIEHPCFPDTVHDVIFQPNQFSVMWNGRIERCYVMPEIVDLVNEELAERTNYDVIFFMTGNYSVYGTPMFKECCHYFSSYDRKDGIT